MKTPTISNSAYIAPGAVVLGDVTIEDNCSIWFHATVRGERASIRIGEGTNIQDNCVVHVDEDFSVDIGKGVTIGHSAVIHGCRIGDNSLIGMGAILLNGASIGKNCIIGAGALVTQNSIIPDNSLVIGSPASIKRMITPKEAVANQKNALHYIEEAQEYRNMLSDK